MGPLPQVSDFTFVVNPSTAMICTGSPSFTNVSLVALQHFAFPKNFFAARIARAKARSRFFADI
jgi:hypothetical protein